MSLKEFVKQLQEYEFDGSNKISTPKEITGVELRPYQLTGLNWMFDRYEKGVSGILADEMGLGKTLQAISLLTYLHFHKNIKGPFLVLCPLTILDNWESELKRFSPKFRVLKYIGDKETRENKRKMIVESIAKLNPKSSNKEETILDFDIFLTTYELILHDMDFIKKFSWKYVVVDEAHRLKNSNSILYKSMLSEMKMPRKLFLTGTPIQNNLSELWALLHFLNPEIFSDLDKFKTWFAKVDISSINNNMGDQSPNPKSKSSEVIELHHVLRPFLLRRLKSDVLIDLPPKLEFILYTGMSKMQKEYYKWVLTKNINVLTSLVNSNSKKTISRTSLMNTIIHLRKACNHPYLFDGAEPLFDGEYVLGDHLISNSGKLMVLDKLLTKLKAEGHKVLIFSQMTRMLDIIQDYLHLKDFSYERLDGSVRGEERFIAVNKFNQSESDTFVFLLSTRAGGQGLNLTAADTVIFIDSDWNPQRDLQAEARAHRIGQTRLVRVIRLITKSSVEEIVLKRAMEKLRLTNQVIEKGQFSQTQSADADESDPTFASANELQEYLQFGLKKIFENEESTITDADVDSILSTNTQVIEAPKTEEKKEISSKKKSPKKKGKEEEKETSTASAVTEDDILKRTLSNMYKFEGVDYSEISKKEDENVLQELLKEATKENESEVSTLSKRASRKRNISSLSPASSQISAEEIAEQKRRKKEERIQKLREKSGYISRVMSPSFVDWETIRSELEKAEQHVSQMTDNIDLHSSNREDLLDIECVTGDATQPKGPSDKPMIILNCVDNSGEWSRGGFFKAISRLSKKVEDGYQLAAQMKDLELGSVQLIDISESLTPNTATPMEIESTKSEVAKSPVKKTSSGKDEENKTNENFKGKLFIATIIAQERKRNKISGIKIPEFSKALDILAYKALQLNATIHSPRIGAKTPDFNWYSIERAIRRSLITRGIPTFIYYYKRSANQSASLSQDSPIDFVKTTDTQEFDYDSPPEQSLQSPSKLTKSPSVSMSVTPVRKQASVASLTPARALDPLPDIFKDAHVLLYGLDEETSKSLGRYIIAFGGEVQLSFNLKSTTHIATIKQAPKGVIKALMKRAADLKVVDIQWIQDCVDYQKFLEETSYIIPL